MTGKRLPFTLMAMELVFATAFFAMLFLYVVKIRLKPFSLAFSSEGFDYFILLVLGGLAGFFYLFLRQRFPQTLAEHGKVTRLYRTKTKEKISHAREDARILASIVLELGLILFIVLGIYAVWDEKIALFQKNIPWLGKVIIIVGLMAVAVYAYLRFSKPFREFGGFYMTLVRPPTEREEKKLKKAMNTLGKKPSKK